HEGTINVKSGSVFVENGTLESGSFVVDLSTIAPTDNGYNVAEGKTPEALVGHLSSADFFDVANYPTASFEITSVSGSNATGNLTIRGKTNVETVTDIAVKQGDDMMKMSGKLTFDRKKYGVAFDHPVKEMVLNDEITLNIKLVAGL
ncbi:MAG: polyisoprenoid-binding protein YceI, partial [Glaciecola sp.]